jgi:putative oxidoreductase
MQRLYSTFPSGVPGGGLLLLRLAAGFPLVVSGAAGLHGEAPGLPLGLNLAGIVAGLLLIPGVWTPYAGVLQAAVEGLLGLQSGTAEMHLIRAATGVALAGLGPGAWSIDARLFGRKRIDA